MWMVVSDIRNPTKKSGKNCAIRGEDPTKSEFTRVVRAFWNSELPRHLAYNDKQTMLNLQVLSGIMNGITPIPEHEVQLFHKPASRQNKVCNSVNAMKNLTDLCRFISDINT